MSKELKLDKTSWVKTKLGELAEEISVRVENPSKSQYDRFVGLDCFVSGELKIKKWSATSNVNSSAKAFKVGDVLFARRNAYLKRASLVEFDGCCSGDAFVLRENHDKIVPGFLGFIVNSEELWTYANSNAEGTMSKRVKWRDLANYEFLLPPKAQQAELAELLWAMDTVIEKDLEVLERLEVNFGVFLNHFFKSDTLFRSMKIKDFSKVYSGSTPLRSNNEYFLNGDIPWVKTLDLNNSEIIKTEELITKHAVKNSNCKIRPIDSVLVAMYGGFNQIGRTGLLKIEAATNQALSVIVVDKEVVMPEFLQLFLNLYVEDWKKVAVSSRKDPNITKDDVENFNVLLPELNVQKQVVFKAQEFKSIILNTKSKLQSSNALQKALINQIF